MNLRTRITAGVVATAAIGTLLLGSVAILGLRSAQVSDVDGYLQVVVEQARGGVGDPISEAVLTVDESDIPIALGFATDGIEAVWLRTIPAVDIAPPSREQLKRSLRDPITAPNNVRMVSILLPDGEYLIAAASLASIDREARNATFRLLWLWLPFNAALAALISFFVARDVRHMEQLVFAASNIAAGAADVEIPQSGKTSEAKALASALDRLVLSLQQSLETERELNQRMQEFLGDASHELRTPLTVIKGYLELLEHPDALEGEHRERALERMRTEAARMELLVNDLLLLAEIGSTRDEDISEVDLTGLVRVLVDDLRALQPERAITTNIASDIVVQGVPSHVHRAIANAMANIRRHTPSDAPVNVDLYADGAMAHLTIEDGGPGLAPENYDRGIGHFQRFDKSRSRTSGGSGLGMSIMAAVIERLGGTIALRPSALGGLALDFTLPAGTSTPTMKA